ncbi:MAG: hypothetical protein ACO3II_08530, partial [Ilumatobacteraceae bacterium]
MTLERFAGPMRLLLGAALFFAGIGHLTAQRTEFQAQVPSWFPVDADLVVVVSGIVEILLGTALIALPKHRVIVGTIVAGIVDVIGATLGGVLGVVEATLGPVLPLVAAIFGG